MDSEDEGRQMMMSESERCRCLERRLDLEIGLNTIIANIASVQRRQVPAEWNNSSKKPGTGSLEASVPIFANS